MNFGRIQIDRRLRASIWLTMLIFSLAPKASFPVDAAEPDNAVTVRSPDDAIRFEFRLNEKTGAATFTVHRGDQRLLDESRLGLEFAESGALNRNLKITNVARAQRDETYPVVAGKSSEARDHYREAVVSLEETNEPQRRIDVVVRAYNDGAAFRYRIPEQRSLSKFVLTGESTSLSFAGNPKAWYLPLKNFTTSYEGLYETSPVKEIPAKTLIGLPILLEYTGNVWLSATEAALTDYAGMYITPASDRPGSFESRLSPLPGQTNAKVKTSAPHDTPWRVLMIADDPGRLIESNLILNLNMPCAIADTSWIKPGKTTFPWWNGFVVKDVDFKGDLNTATMKHYIDFCAAHGIEYHSLDGFQNRAWYGGPIHPEGETDITTAVPEIDLPELLQYAKQKGVRLRLWMHWKALKPQIDEAFSTYEKWGIEGVMVDFMDRDDQEMVEFYREMVEKAARHRLTVTLHGAYKPTGLRRTWPNLMNREGVLNLEYNKFKNAKCPPGHNLTVPFTRMLAGPVDYHHGGFRTVPPDNDKPNDYIGPTVIGTRAHYIAMYAVYDNPLPMLADYPAAYRNQTGFEFLCRMPTAWDETRVLQAEVGRSIAVARRKGDVWYVGAMTNETPREVELPLQFLGRGDYTTEVYSDPADDDPSDSKIMESRSAAKAGDRLQIKMNAAGGWVARFAPKR